MCSGVLGHLRLGSWCGQFGLARIAVEDLLHNVLELECEPIWKYKTDFSLRRGQVASGFSADLLESGGEFSVLEAKCTGD